MGDFLLDCLNCLWKLLVLTLGVPVVCGLAVRLCAWLFSGLCVFRSGRVFDVTSMIGTPVHELGHAVMCPLFGHRIQKICLWSPRHTDGVYGYVEHTYNKRNLWARLGSLFIGMGPLFSGLGVTVLVLFLCFPDAWREYLAVTRDLMPEGTPTREIVIGVFTLLRSLPSAIAQNWIPAVIGLLIVLPVSLHITLSVQDIRASLGAFPIWVLLAAVASVVLTLCNVSGQVVSFLQLWNLRLLALFALVIAFAAVWVLLALLIRVIRIIVGWF